MQIGPSSGRKEGTDKSQLLAEKKLHNLCYFRQIVEHCSVGSELPGIEPFRGAGSWAESALPAK